MYKTKQDDKIELKKDVCIQDVQGKEYGAYAWHDNNNVAEFVVGSIYVFCTFFISFMFITCSSSF